MAGKRYSTEQIIVKLREAEIEVGRGLKVPEVCRKLGISEQTFYRWRRLYGGPGRQLGSARRWERYVHHSVSREPPAGGWGGGLW